MNTLGPSCHPQGIRGYGSPDEGVMLVGLSPGRNEVREGRPFTGRSGQLLDAILEAGGWHRDKVYCTNLVCYPAPDDAPSGLDFAPCARRLCQEIATFKPRLIVPLGKISAEYFLAGRTIGQAQGAVLWTQNVLGSGHDCYVMSTYHPAAILHGVTAFVHPIYRDLSKIKDVVTWKDWAPQADVLVQIATTDDDLMVWLRDRSFDATIAVDVETAQGKDIDGMLDIHNDQLLCVGLSDGTNTIVVPEQHAHRWFSDGDDHSCIAWTFHNGNFDVQALHRFLGVKLPIIHDTMLMSYALDERPGVHGLKGLAREYLGTGFYEDEAHGQAKTRKGYEHVEKIVLYDYNGRDAAYTARLVPILWQKMLDDNVVKPYLDLMIPAANAFAAIQERGIKVDLPRLNQLELKFYPLWLQTRADLQAHGEALGAPAPFNPNSGPQLKRLVFDILGLVPPTGKVSEKTGVPSLDKTVLEELKGMHPYIDEIHSYRQLDHDVTTMLTVREQIKLDGALHATTKQHGTVTARTSYVDPALQTIPNPKYESNARFAEFRQIFVPHNTETHIIAEADLSRAEMWAAVSYSHDEQMLQDLLTGDPHTNTAVDVFKKPREKVTREDRTKIKHVVFGTLYGRGAKALAKGELQCSVAEAEVFVNRFKARYKTYMEWNEKQRRIAQTEGELISLTGRKRRFRLIMEQDFKMLNEAVNFGIQNLASDTTLKAMILLHKLLIKYDSYVLIMIHDSIVFELSKKYLHITLPLIKETMEQPMFEGTYGIPIELATGPNWGETKEVNTLK